jgi:Domain of unknown function DUF11/PASTA domain
VPASIGGKIYGTQGNGCNGFAIYDIASNTWTQGPNVPDGAVLGGAINPVSDIFFAYGDYEGAPDGSDHFYAYEIGNNTGFTRFSNVQDAAVTASAGPPNATVGFPALLSATITGHGSAATPITFTDHGPAGLTIDSVANATGTCSTSGQLVMCTFTGVSPGQSAVVNIIVTPTASGSYTNSVSVTTASGITDTNSANNSASATLHAAAATLPPPPKKCVVPKLKGTPLSVARHVLHLLDCKVGKVRHAHSKSVGKGRIIKTSPEAGSYNAGRVIRLEVSSGRRKARKKVTRKKVTHPAPPTSGLG